MKYIFFFILFIPLLLFSQNDVTVGDIGGNSVLSSVTADDTTRWAQNSDSTYDEIDIEDSLRVAGAIKWTQKTLTDTFVLIIYDNNIIDTASLVEAASWALEYPLKPFILEYIDVREKGELLLLIKEKGSVIEKNRLLKPYTASDVQLQSEIERLYRRVFRLYLSVILLFMLSLSTIVYLIKEK